MSEKLTDLLDCLPPVARGDRVSVPRETYERVRLAIAELAAAEERGRRAGIEEAARLFDNCCDVMLAVELIPSRIRGLAPRDSGKEPDFLAAMDAVRDDLKRKGVRVNTVEMLTELYEGRGHSHEEALRMARGEPDPEDRK